MIPEYPGIVTIKYQLLLPTPSSHCNRFEETESLVLLTTGNKVLNIFSFNQDGMSTKEDLEDEDIKVIDIKTNLLGKFSYSEKISKIT